MTPEARYLIASARLVALSDPQTWTPDDLADVSALVEPPMSFARWLARRNAQGQTAPAIEVAPVAQDDANKPDYETTATVDSLLGGELRQLVKNGIVNIEEGPPL
jgi:hypothetical protein